MQIVHFSVRKMDVSNIALEQKKQKNNSGACTSRNDQDFSRWTGRLVVQLSIPHLDTK